MRTIYTSTFTVEDSCNVNLDLATEMANFCFLHDESLEEVFCTEFNMSREEFSSQAQELSQLGSLFHQEYPLVVNIFHKKDKATFTIMIDE